MDGVKSVGQHGGARSVHHVQNGPNLDVLPYAGQLFLQFLSFLPLLGVYRDCAAKVDVHEYLKVRECAKNDSFRGNGRYHVLLRPFRLQNPP